MAFKMQFLRNKKDPDYKNIALEILNAYKILGFSELKNSFLFQQIYAITVRSKVKGSTKI